jgi:hypothetical protein
VSGRIRYATDLQPGDVLRYGRQSKPLVRLGAINVFFGPPSYAAEEVVLTTRVAGNVLLKGECGFVRGIPMTKQAPFGLPNLVIVRAQAVIYPAKGGGA